MSKTMKWVDVTKRLPAFDQYVLVRQPASGESLYHLGFLREVLESTQLVGTEVTKLKSVTFKVGSGEVAYETTTITHWAELVSPVDQKETGGEQKLKGTDMHQP